MLYLLNTPILTNYGNYCFSGPLTVEQAQALLKQPFVSAIGHGDTAALLSQLLEQNIPTNRVAITMKAGDQALVFRLLQRIPEGVILNQQQLSQLPYELGLLDKLS